MVRRQFGLPCGSVTTWDSERFPGELQVTGIEQESPCFLQVRSLIILKYCFCKKRSKLKCLLLKKSVAVGCKKSAESYQIKLISCFIWCFGY